MEGFAYFLGIITAIVLTGALSFSYGMGKRDIVHDCEKFHSFIYKDTAYKCQTFKYNTKEEREEATSTSQGQTNL